MADTALLRAAYGPWLRLAGGLDEATGWHPTRLPGWTVRDLLLHLSTDCQRALVALFTPAHAAADTDEVSYWRSWQPGGDETQSGLRGTRIMASAWSRATGPADQFAGTARALLTALDRADPDEVICTQGHALTVAGLAHTLAVEATVHHVDLADATAETPDDRCLGEVRRVVEALLGCQFPRDWTDERCLLLGTGRQEPTDADTTALGAVADRLPAFG